MTSNPEVQPDSGGATRFPALDGLRALAALSVVGTHVGFNSGVSIGGGVFGATLSRLDFGVAVFFLLSGFLLYRPFALSALTGRPRPSVGAFWVRRALRIFPAVWLMVAVTLAVITRYVVHPSDWASYLTLVQVYNHHDYDPNLTHLWTLSVEVSFYAALPLIAWLASGRGRRSREAALRRQGLVLAAMVVAAIAFTVAQDHRWVDNSQALLWLPGFLDWFAGGMLLAVLSCLPGDGSGDPRWLRAPREWASAPGTCLLVATALFALSALPIGVPRNLAPATSWEWSIQHELFLLSAFFLMLPLVIGPRTVVSAALGSRVGHLAGDLSYGVYLWHVPLMIWLQREAGFTEFRGHFWALLGMTVASATTVAALSWFLVERPILRYGARRLRRAPSPTQTAASAATQSS